MVKANKEILLTTSRRAFSRCLTLGCLFALSPVFILVMGEIVTGTPSPYNWFWFFIPASVAGLVVWSNRPSSLAPVRLTIVDFALRSSELPNREIPLAGIRRVQIRRGLFNVIFGLRRLRIQHSGKLQYGIAGLTPEDAELGLSFIDRWRQLFADKPQRGRLLTAQEWRSAQATGDWRQIYAESAGLRLFEIIHALFLFALGIMLTGSVLIAGISNLHSPQIPPWETVRKAYWGYIIVLPVLVVVPAILGSMLVYGWRHVADLFMPTVMYQGILERKYTGQSTRTQLHFIGSGSWDWQLPSRQEHARLALRDEILVRFRRRSQEAREIYTR